MSSYGKRNDGTTKGEGWLGPQTRPDGDVSTELSIGVDLDGEETELPLMVPTLTKEEIDHLLSGRKATKEIVDKAIDHAVTRKKEGKSPFADDEESKAAVAARKAHDDSAEEEETVKAFKGKSE